MAIHAASSSTQIHGKRSSQFSIAGHQQCGRGDARGLALARLTFWCSCAVSALGLLADGQPSGAGESLARLCLAGALAAGQQL